MEKELSKELLDKLTEIICVDIGSKVIDGVTYALLSNSPKDKVKTEKYLSVRRLIDNEGFSANEIFRVYEVSNGYIFDIDLNIVKTITSALLKLASKNNPNLSCMKDLIGNRPETKREADMMGLAKVCLKADKEGKDSVEVSLFNRNKTGKIIISADGLNSEKAVITYPAYVIRPNDLEDINIKYLVERGMRITSVETCEILGNNSGLRVILNIGKRVRKSY